MDLITALRNTRVVTTSIYARSALIVILVLGLGLMSGIALAAPPASHGGFANPAAVDLLSVDNFTALAATGVSSPTAGTELHDGDLGVTGVGCTDFPVPCTTPGVGGVVIGGAIIVPPETLATIGQTDATAVVTDLNLRGLNATIAGGLLDGLTLGQGVYDVPAAVTNLTGTLTLHGDADSIFIFRFPSTFITGSTAVVRLTGGAQACNVYWTSVAETTFNDTTTMVGTVFAGTSITFPGGGAVLDGRVIAQTAEIVFNNTTINNSECLAPTPTPLPTNTPTPRPRPTSTPTAGLPVTGFAQGVDTILAEQPEELAYSSLGDLWLEIPDLDVETSIVGVPQVNGEWDVSWLGSDAGWLYGTAFPTWAGNSALTGHVYDANGDPGPFARLSWLQFGDQVVVHAWGLAYTFEIRSVGTVYATTRVSSVITHEAFPWLTLITCSGYDEATDSYKYRVIARAILVSIDYD